MSRCTPSHALEASHTGREWTRRGAREHPRRPGGNPASSAPPRFCRRCRHPEILVPPVEQRATAATDREWRRARPSLKRSTRKSRIEVAAVSTARRPASSQEVALSTTIGRITQRAHALCQSQTKPKSARGVASQRWSTANGSPRPRRGSGRSRETMRLRFCRRASASWGGIQLQHFESDKGSD